MFTIGSFLVERMHACILTIDDNNTSILHLNSEISGSLTFP